MTGGRLWTVIVLSYSWVMGAQWAHGMYAETFTRIVGPYTCPGNTLEENKLVPTVQYCENLCKEDAMCAAFVVTPTFSCHLKSACTTMASSTPNTIGFPLTGAKEHGGKQFSRLMSPYICVSERDETVATSVNIPTADQCEKECLGTPKCAAFVHFYIPGGANGMVGMCVLKKTCTEFESSPFPTVMGFPLAEAEPFEPLDEPGSNTSQARTTGYSVAVEEDTNPTATIPPTAAANIAALSEAVHDLDDLESEVSLKSVEVPVELPAEDVQTEVQTDAPLDDQQMEPHDAPTDAHLDSSAETQISAPGGSLGDEGDSLHVRAGAAAAAGVRHAQNFLGRRRRSSARIFRNFYSSSQHHQTFDYTILHDGLMRRLTLYQSLRTNMM